MRQGKKSNSTDTTSRQPIQRRASEEVSFAEVVHLIESARQKAFRAVNTALIDLYWQIGEYISARIAEDGWGKGTVTALADYIQKEQPGLRGFSPQNLWRMRQFYETYRDEPKLSPLVRELPWTHNLMALSRCKSSEEREFYLRLSLREHWTKRELERQLAGALFERTVLNPPKLSTALREKYPATVEVFKDVYLLEFLGLADVHSELDLHRSLVLNLGRFITELGRDFCFVGSEYTLQVGGKDFFLDLLFYHRGLNCLVAVELKIDEFQPEHLGKLEFYLEALDRDVRKPHERPSIGILLCATKDSEVVEYTLSRTLSPTLVAEYQTQLPDKKLLQAKLREFYALSAPQQSNQDSHEF
ncbi:MAG: PDDEXK nuclease domain-containing protein [Candidatus Hatepunaea meridiana]|nr:PDDEXK nuclease domain-containing protein [Candidatus Hatepunaea meridiana]